jgi:hypothetical protein
MERAKAVENNERAKLTTRGIEMAKQLDDDMLLNMHYQTSLQQHHLKEKRSLKDALEYKPKEYKTDSMRERLIREFAQNQMSIEITAAEIRRRGLTGKKGSIQRADEALTKEEFYRAKRRYYGKGFRVI